MNRIILLLISALFLSGCTNEDEKFSYGLITNEDRYTFTGSSENWEASYEVVITDREKGGNQVDEDGTAEFIDEGESPKLIDYKLVTESGTNSSEGMGITMNDKVVSFAQHSCGNCVPMQIDEGLELEIMWDGKSEKIILTPME